MKVRKISLLINKNKLSKRRNKKSLNWGDTENNK